MRNYNYSISELIQTRWSPRAFSHESVPREELMAVLEAARYAPSCFNEQPWRFVVPENEPQLEMLRSFLTEKNQRWARKAPWLILILSCRNFSANGKPNRWHQFDTGTAWGFMSLEAVRRGLVTHAMGGFSVAEARASLGISEDYDIVAMVAVGRYGNPDELDEDLKATEAPGVRKPLEDSLWKFDDRLGNLK